MAHEVTLQHPDFSKPFTLQVDASDIGAGMALLQKDDTGNLRPIAYHSKTFNQAERNYSAVERECYALILGLDKFAEYLDGATFTIETDNSAVTYLNQMRNKNARLMRWALRLQEWCPKIVHIKGTDNVLADMLSRSPAHEDFDHKELLSPSPLDFSPSVNSFSMLCNIDKKILLSHQNKAASRDIMLKQPDKFCEHHGIIYSRQANGKLLPVIPPTLLSTVISAFHDSPLSGHMGAEKTSTNTHSSILPRT